MKTTLPSNSQSSYVSGEIASQIIEERHIWFCMLYKFRKGNSATVSAKSINDVYPNSLVVRKIQRWLTRF
ncbi:unnamed protein product [Larinioides sclopetarius]|uniref:Mos1 transposase HTH domain-containing protein n=1 Tax=Larinioides sclopetarius TaxID=280406 RepID=A0AAV1ZPU9_9ARAC